MRAENAAVWSKPGDYNPFAACGKLAANVRLTGCKRCLGVCLGVSIQYIVSDRCERVTPKLLLAMGALKPAAEFLVCAHGTAPIRTPSPLPSSAVRTKRHHETMHLWLLLRVAPFDCCFSSCGCCGLCWLICCCSSDAGAMLYVGLAGGVPSASSSTSSGSESRAVSTARPCACDREL